MSAVSHRDLARTVNLRELGGIRASNGREVKRGVVYRSATLAGLSVAELAAMRALQIRSVVDLRHNSERAAHPTPWQEMGCRHYWSQDVEPARSGGLADLLDNESMTAAAAHDLMIRAYQTLPYGSVEGIRQLFRSIVTGEGPFLFHCTAGKDRTGITAALLLSTLGVPREAILADYLATADYEILESPGYRREVPLPPARLEALRPIYGVDAAYIDSMFDAITARDGSVEGFLCGPVELSAADLDGVRKHLLS